MQSLFSCCYIGTFLDIFKRGCGTLSYLNLKSSQESSNLPAEKSKVSSEKKQKKRNSIIYGGLTSSFSVVVPFEFGYVDNDSKTNKDACTCCTKYGNTIWKLHLKILCIGILLITLYCVLSTSFIGVQVAWWSNPYFIVYYTLDIVIGLTFAASFLVLLKSPKFTRKAQEELVTYQTSVENVKNGSHTHLTQINGVWVNTNAMDK